jgi:ATP-dependent Clp protease ATP-binding subunit ClpA
MTENRKAKRAVRARMARTGEKYTEARRGLGDDRGGDGAPRSVPRDGAGDPIGWFTDQGYNAILLAEDEARMLGQPRVEPEHLLLAAARYGNVERLLAAWNNRASAIYAALVQTGGFGTEIVLGRVPRSAAADMVLWRAITAAHERGIRAPSPEHVLLGLQGEDVAIGVLRDLGLGDVTDAVDAKYPVERPPVPREAVARYAEVARSQRAPRPGPIPPVFERFTREAHRAIEAGVASARALNDEYVTPVHLLQGLLESEVGVVADVLARHAPRRHSAGRSTPNAPVDRSSRATGIFTAEARRFVAEQVLTVAGAHGHRSLSTGHLLLAILESPDDETLETLRAVPDADQILIEVRDALPGNEHP